jgi:hypothetical protein
MFSQIFIFVLCVRKIYVYIRVTFKDITVMLSCVPGLDSDRHLEREWLHAIKLIMASFNGVTGR